MEKRNQYPVFVGYFYIFPVGKPALWRAKTNIGVEPLYFKG
jgi:hypothetical protein